MNETLDEQSRQALVKNYKYNSIFVRLVMLSELK